MKTNEHTFSDCWITTENKLDEYINTEIERRIQCISPFHMAGFSFIPMGKEGQTYKSGASCAYKAFQHWSDPECEEYWKLPCWIQGIPVLREYIAEEFPGFFITPYQKDFLVLDVDCGHNNGFDGIESFYSFFRQKSILLPSYLSDIRGGSFPVYTKTPSGGFHLFFTSDGNKYKSCKFCNSVDVRNYKALLAVPGSKKPNGEYVFYGKLSDAPHLPPIIKRFLHHANEESTLHIKGRTTRRQVFLESGQPDTASKIKKDSFQQIYGMVTYLLMRAQCTGMNNFLFRLARWCYRIGISREVLSEYLRTRLKIDPLNPEIQHCIREE